MADVAPTHPRRGSGGGLLRGLLRGFLQRLRGWGRHLLALPGLGPLVPGERILLLKRLRNGAAVGVGMKLALASKNSWRKVEGQSLGAIICYLRPFTATLALAAAGAGANAALYLLQLRYYEADLSVLPPESLWQHVLRALFGARPPAKRTGPPSAAAAAAAADVHAPQKPPPLQQQQPQEPVPPPASPAVGSQFAGSPASSFVDVNASPPRLPLPEGPEGHGVWSDVPLGGITPAASVPEEDWTEVAGPASSGGASPHHPGSSPPREEGQHEGPEAATVAPGQQQRLSFKHLEQ